MHNTFICVTCNSQFVSSFHFGIGFKLDVFLFFYFEFLPFFCCSWQNKINQTCFCLSSYSKLTNRCKTHTAPYFPWFDYVLHLHSAVKCAICYAPRGKLQRTSYDANRYELLPRMLCACPFHHVPTVLQHERRHDRENELDSSTSPQLADCRSLVVCVCFCLCVCPIVSLCVYLYRCTTQQAGAADVQHTHTHTVNIYTAAAQQVELVTLKNPSLRDSIRSAWRW